MISSAMNESLGNCLERLASRFSVRFFSPFPKSVRGIFLPQVEKWAISMNLYPSLAYSAYLKCGLICDSMTGIALGVCF